MCRLYSEVSESVNISTVAVLTLFWGGWITIPDFCALDGRLKFLNFMRSISFREAYNK